MKKLLQNNSNILIGLSIGLIVAIVIILANFLSLLDMYELKTVDARFKMLHSYRNQPSKDIIVVGIDDISVATIGRWPWKREEHAKIVNFLNLYGAKAIFYDIFFSYRDKDHLQSDQKFIESIKNAKNAYLAGKYIPISQNLQDDIQIVEKDKFMKKFALNTVDITARDASEVVPKGKEVAYEIPFYELASVTKRIGPVHVGSNEDGIIRYQFPVYKYKGDYYPGLSFGLTMDLLNINTLYNYKTKGYLLGDTLIPLDEQGRMIVNWYGKYDKQKEFVPTYEQWSAWRFIESYESLEKASKACGLTIVEFKQLIDKINQYKNEEDIPNELWQYIEKIPEDFELSFEGWDPAELFKDKIILIGVASTSTTVRDIISNPFLEELPGVFLHANVIDNILQKDFLSKVSFTHTNLIILFVAILSGLSVFGVRNSFIGVLSPILLAILYLATTIIAFTHFNLWMDIVYVESTIVITFAISSAVYYIIEGREKLKVRYALSNYLSPQIMTEVLSDPKKLNLGGSKRMLSILFTDIKGFTNISETSNPEEVVSMLNEYFTAMVEIIFKNKGTFDKFIGDAIMAFWNAPLDIEDHAFLAVKTAIDMTEELQRLREKWKSQGKQEIDIRIGVNTAEVTVGNIGSDKIKDYTIIGDGVNLASRIEGLNKEYNTRIMISEYTYELVKDKINTRYLDTTKVKGKEQPVKVYEVLGLKTKGEELCQNQQEFSRSSLV
ncbi:MAG: hypothetical protein ACD_20C00035G0003 [uncultured bacterium]|nr:MAG: hypothetical protein ACD_20C00035G0003 [uncultured bacterium]HBH17681.1 hypothetical protein [Cyanobacteria bacterium UBA9579]